MANTDYIEERLLAYIYPRRPSTSAQEDALDRAVTAQAAFEDAAGVGDVPGGVASMANDGVSLTFREGANGAGYSRETLSPAAWSILRNAGLIAYVLPTAKKP